jgi:putative DNA primase/helicase
VFYLAQQNGWQSPRKDKRSDGKTKTDTEASDADELPPEAEDTIALVFAERHANELRYVNAWGRWISFEGAHWIEDNTLHTFDRVRAVCRELAAAGEHSPRAVASAKTIVAVERLAKADRRLAATAEQWDNNSWMLNERTSDDGNL